MSASRTATLVLTGALGFGSLVGLAAPALAETPPHEGPGMVLTLGEDDGGLDGPGDIAQPEPAPQPPQDKAPVPQPDPEPQPQPGPGDLVQPAGDPDPDPDPDLPDGPGDLADGGCHATHGCEPEGPGDLTDHPGDEDDCHPLAASCDLTDREPGGSGGDEPGVLDHTEDRGALPRTGAGLAALALAGSALTGLGAALRRAARR